MRRLVHRRQQALGAMGTQIPAWVWFAGLSALALVIGSQSKTVKKVVFAAGDRTARVLDSLASSFRPTVEEFVRQARAEGYPIVLTDGGRTFAAQHALYEQGRTKPGKIVTNADSGESPHNFGLSIDFAFGDALGQPTWPNDAPWGKVAAIGKSLGLKWGGDWASFKDQPHLEAPDWKTVQATWRRSGSAEYTIV